MENLMEDMVEDLPSFAISTHRSSMLMCATSETAAKNSPLIVSSSAKDEIVESGMPLMQITNGNGHSSLPSEDSFSIDLESRGSANSGPRHSPMRRYVCKHCEYTTPSYSSLHSHFKYLHPRLARVGNLVQHYKRTDAMQGSKRVPILYACMHCNYITLSMRGFMLHSNKIHPKRKVNPLKQGTPITTPTNKKYLEALYLSKDEPQRIKNKIHKLLMAYHPDSIVLEEMPKYISTDCILCGQKLQTDVLLGQHYELIHSQQGPKKNCTTGLYHCKMCSYDTLTRLALYKHYASSHFMDAFYAWNVPLLEPMLRQCERTFQNHRIHKRQKNLLEKPDAYLPSCIVWDAEDATESQTAKNSVPCIACDFSSSNLIELISHYQKDHHEYYPQGFQLFILQRLHLHAETICLNESEAGLMDEVHGAWVDKNDQLVQHYKYQCKVCDFTCNWFENIRLHLLQAHPLQSESVENVRRNIALMKPPMIKQCSKCGFVGLSGTDIEINEHFEQKHQDCTDTISVSFTVHDIEERRCCSFCSFVGNFDAMQWHYAENHYYGVIWSALRSEFPVPSLQRSCCVCDYASTDERDLAEHYQQHHFNESLTFKISIPYQDYQCTLCSAVLYSLSGIIRHHQRCANKITFKGENMQNKSTKRYLFCKHCRKIYLDSTQLWVHITENHCPFSRLFTVDDLPTCTLKYGIWEPNYEVYESNRTEKRRETRSDVDNRCSVYSSGDFNNNILSNESSPAVLPEDFMIRNGDGDNSGSELPDMISYKSSSSLRCKFCSYSATHHGKLKRHLTSVHHHDLSFRCFSCDEQFSAVAECTAHLSHFHGLIVGCATLENFLLNDIVVLTSRSSIKYMCAWCGYQGFSKFVVLNHFNSCHILNNTKRKKRKKSKNYSCKFCDYYTKNATSMRAHLDAKHNRVVSYHSLTNFCKSDSNIAEASESSDDSSGKKSYPVSRNRAKIKTFNLVQLCSLKSDSDFSDVELYKSTHDRCKHQSRYPYTCKFCMKAFVCSTTFLKHCMNEHSELCEISSTLKHITVLPDPCAIPRFVEKLIERQWNCKNSIVRSSSWPCEFCGIEKNTLLEIQEHIRDAHNGQKVFMCRNCDYTSLNGKSIVCHVNGQPSHGSDNSLLLRKNRDDVSTQRGSDLDQRENSSSPILYVEMAVSQAKEATKVEANGMQSPPRARKSIRSGTRNLSVQPNFSVEESSFDQESCSSKDTGSSKSRIASYSEHVHTSGGVIRCRNCDFTCTEAQRMKVHVDTSHSPTKSYSCKFCNYVSKDFASLDSHLAEFHKIKRNHQLGLQVHSSNGNYPALSEEARQTFSEVKSRFLYTPAPCLPILKEEVMYIECDEENDSTEGVKLTCSYCGFAASSTFDLETHMRRHEGAFHDSVEDSDNMSYTMKKMNVVSHFST